VFQISTWGAWSFVWGDKPAKASLWQQRLIYFVLSWKLAVPSDTLLILLPRISAKQFKAES